MVLSVVTPGGTEVVTESDFPNGHAGLEQAVSIGRPQKEKMVYMAVRDTSQEDEELSE